MEVYADLLIIENLIMNYIILWVTAKFSREPTSIIKLFVSALVGAIYSTVIFFPQCRFIYTIYFKILFSLLLIVIAFHPEKLMQLIRLTSIFYIVSFVFGGAAFALFYFTDINAVVSNGIFYISRFPIKLLLISSIISYITIKFSWTAIQNRLSKENILVEIDILFESKLIQLKALIDTGNSLYDPISNYPVIIVEFEAIKELLPNDLIEIIQKSKEIDLSTISNIISNTNLASRFRLIPFSSIGRENGMLIGFKPDEVLIIETESTKKIKDIIIGIYTNKLSRDRTYSALLHPKAIEL